MDDFFFVLFPGELFGVSVSDTEETVPTMYYVNISTIPNYINNWYKIW